MSHTHATSPLRSRPPAAVPAGAAPPPPTDPLAIAALVLAILFWPAGLVLGFVALARINASGLGGRRFANASIVVSTVAAVAIVVIAAIMLTTAGG